MKIDKMSEIIACASNPSSNLKGFATAYRKRGAAPAQALTQNGGR